MLTKTKSRARKAKRIPPPGRKMSKQEARDYVFKTHRETMSRLAKH